MVEVIEGEVVYDPQEEAQLLARLREMREAKRHVETLGDDFSLDLARWVKNPEDLSTYRQLVQRLPEDPDEALQALIAGLGGALGAQVLGGSTGAGIGAALSVFLFNRTRRARNATQ